jgi:hypothetical protein
MRILFPIAMIFAAACSGNSSPAAQARTNPGASSTGLVVVELFQSQGCSSCPPANANVNALAGRPGVLALSYAVTYWDYLGWKDRFAQPAFTQRQRDYAKSGRSDGVYTPQVVINGSRAVVGANAATLGKAMRAAGSLAGGPALSREGSRVSIGAVANAVPAQVLLVTYDPRERPVPIKAGENTGKTLPHRNIVTNLTVAGAWTGKPLRIDLPELADPALRRALLLQEGTGGRLIAAMTL